MHVDENEFFREATIRLCGTLDVQQAMRDCCDYIKKFVPVSRMYLQLFDPNLNVLAIMSSVIREGEEGSRVIHIPQEYKNAWVHNWDGYVIINDPSKEAWFWKDLLATGRNPDISLILIRLKIGDNTFCWFALVTDGQGAYTEEHARLMLLLKKPLTIAVANALQHEEVLRLKNLLADEHRRLYQKLRELSSDIIGKQAGLKEVMGMCREVAPLDSPVLLLGETGVGKDLLANAIHAYSPRKQAPFVSVNCGAIAETLLDSELFGHEKGAFTGAVSQKMGRFERADKGTVFLDEIGDLSSQGQVRLLHVLQYKEIERVGGTRPIPADTRIIAATNKNLEEMVKSGQFRKDLWFRLSVFPITIPPLRQRRQDIPELLYYFIEQKRRALKLDITPRLSPGAIDQLMAYDWPGNVRELQNIVERALIRNRDGLLRLEELLGIQSQIEHESTEAVDQTYGVRNLDEINSRHISQILKLSKGKINGPGGAAEVLGIHPNTLRKRMDKLGISYKRMS
jgi:transcriptional regulator with GAF, ATPase, and Fis domain